MKRGILFIFSILLLVQFTSAELSYYHYDLQGNVRHITDSNGQVIEKSKYLPFGERFDSDMEDPRGFTGKELDKSDNYYFNARYQSPQEGRFLTPDTVKPSLENPQSLNLYTYTLNNPIKYIDPTGNQEEYQNPDLDFINEIQDHHDNLGSKSSEVSQDLAEFADAVSNEVVMYAAGGVSLKSLSWTARLARWLGLGKFSKGAYKGAASKVSSTDDWKAVMTIDDGMHADTYLVRAQEIGHVTVKKGKAYVNAGKSKHFNSPDIAESHVWSEIVAKGEYSSTLEKMKIGQWVKPGTNFNFLKFNLKELAVHQSRVAPGKPIMYQWINSAGSRYRVIPQYTKDPIPLSNVPVVESMEVLRKKLVIEALGK